ncbi:hypothetical protein [Peribacillus frigoritolerans]|uniref:hypothetical protein n=1 Tax=Peribacillus castrilensis TaxID=2897690 RepID=UPI003DA4F2D8
MIDEGYIGIEEYKANHMHDDPFIKDVDEEGVKKQSAMISKQDYAVKKQGDWYYYNQGVYRGA